MVDVTVILLGISLILFFGFLAEFVFKKTNIPDILFLILLGFLLGPHGLKYVHPSQIEQFAPVFTTFALVFLLFDGAFNIDLASFAKGLTKSLGITAFNFVVSAGVIFVVMYLFKFGLLISLLTAFILAGISSGFVIPIIKRLKIKGETYSVLTLESAITDVLCIVFALTVLEILKFNTFSLQMAVSKIASLFAVAGFIGIIAGILWIILVIKIFKEHNSYMITIAYVILVYVVTEFLHGNGAIAALFLGLVLRNSKQLTSMFRGVVNKSEEGKTAAKDGKGNKETGYDSGVSVTSRTEEIFYSQISFFLKTFFFVYVGVLLNIADTRALLIGLIIALALMVARNASFLVTKGFDKHDRGIMASLFAPGIAAAALAQILVFNGVAGALTITNIVYATVTFATILSSIAVFMAVRKNKE